MRFLAVCGLIGFLTLSGSCKGVPRAGQLHSYPASGFKIAFPGDLAVKTDTWNTEGKGVKATFYIRGIKAPVIATTYSGKVDGLYCSVMHFDYPPAHQKLTSDELMTESVEAQLAIFSVEEKDIERLPSNTGATVKVGEQSIMFRNVLRKKERLYSVLCYFKTTDSAQAERSADVLASFAQVGDL